MTISTVGYGDVYPKSDAGKFICVFVILAGVGYLAMPLAIIGGQFTAVWEDRVLLLASDKLRSNKPGMAKIKDIFEEVDEEREDDASIPAGKMTLEQFDKIMKQLDIGMRGNDIRVIFGKIDSDGSGFISYDEFAEFLAAS